MSIFGSSVRIFVDVYGIVGVEVYGPKDMGLRRYGIDGRAIVAVRDDESVFNASGNLTLNRCRTDFARKASFDIQTAGHRMVLKVLKNLIDQLHVNPPCGSKQRYYTKSAAHCEPQIGYFLIKMSRKQTRTSFIHGNRKAPLYHALTF